MTAVICPVLPVAAAAKGAAAQNRERGEQKDPKFRLFHHTFILGCPAVVVNGFLPWYNGFDFYRFIINDRSRAGALEREADAVSAVTAYAAQAAHFILPVIALIVLIRCIASMFYGRAEPETMGPSRHAGRQGLSPCCTGSA